MSKQQLQYIKNPKSGRNVAVGGRCYKQLVKAGLIDASSNEFVGSKECEKESQDMQKDSQDMQKVGEQKDMQKDSQDKQKDSQEMKESQTAGQKKSKGKKQAKQKNSEEEIAEIKKESQIEKLIEDLDEEKVSHYLAKAAEKVLSKHSEKLKELKDDSKLYDEIKSLINSELISML